MVDIKTAKTLEKTDVGGIMTQEIRERKTRAREFEEEEESKRKRKAVEEGLSERQRAHLCRLAANDSRNDSNVDSSSYVKCKNEASPSFNSGETDSSTL